MQSITTNQHNIHFNEACYNALNTFLKEADISTIFVLVDENTHQHCLPNFLAAIETDKRIEILEIESGETHKTIETCTSLWNVLSELGADRKSLLINLGGGVITDLGGFVASTFKRGINYINVPTSLLAMVDASVGGKTGVDLDHLKNQVGVINTGAMVLIDTSFLQTLPDNQMRSGLAEMLKHGLISSRVYWERIKSQNALRNENMDSLIYESVKIKHDVVTHDPTEKGLRKTLNFGHTLGHAIESYYLNHPDKGTLLHGEAIAIGMILECYISHQLLSFQENDLKDVTHTINTIYKPVAIEPEDYNSIIDLLKFDKKNEHGKIQFVLLETIGNCKINCEVNNDLIIDSIKYYTKSVNK